MTEDTLDDKKARIAALDTAIERAGGIVRFRTALGLTHQAVYHWKRRGWVPLDKALIIERLFLVPREDMIEPRLREAMNTPYQPAADIL